MAKRRDAKLVKTDALHSFTAYMMAHRTEREVHIYKEFDVTKLLKYIDKKNEGVPRDERMRIFHCICMAIARTVKERPLLNRFIKDNRYWDRNEISLSFVAKKRFTDHSEEALMILKADDETTVDSVSRQIIGDVHEARTTDQVGADGALEALAKLPKFLMKIAMGAINLMDRKGCLPQSLIEVDPNHTTVLLTNLGSIKCDAVYHHLSNFGTNSIMVAIGVITKKEVVMEDGTKQIRDTLTAGITLDEMIADGFYFAKSLKIIDYLMEHPEELEIKLGDKINYELD